MIHPSRLAALNPWEDAPRLLMTKMKKMLLASMVLPFCLLIQRPDVRAQLGKLQPLLA